MLRDLEELLHTVIDDGSRDFMAEAVRCYHAGMYRAAVTMAMAAAMDDLRKKLGALVASGVAGVDPSVRVAHTRIEQKFTDQDAFENELIEATTKVGMFTPAEEQKLKVLLKTRHLAAHPSGHRSSAEEARDCVASLIDLVLARPPLMGIAAVNTLVARLMQPNFFPMIGDSARTSAAVEAELRPLLPGSHMALATKLVDAILADAVAAPPPANNLLARLLQRPSPARENLRVFARFMVLAGDSARRAVWSRVGRLIETPDTCKDALAILSTDPTGLRLLDDNPLARERAVALVRRSIGESDARRVVSGWREAGVLNDVEVSDLFAACHAEFVGNPKPSSTAALAELRWPELETLFFQKVVDESGSNIWDRANPAIEAVQGLTPEASARVAPELRAKYVFNVARNAIGTYANNSARPLVTNGLGPRTDFLGEFEAALGQQAARGMPTNWEALVAIIKASNRPDLLGKMLDLFNGATEDEDRQNGLKVARALEQHPDPATAAKATALAQGLLTQAAAPTA